MENHHVQWVNISTMNGKFTSSASLLVPEGNSKNHGVTKCPWFPSMDVHHYRHRRHHFHRHQTYLHSHQHHCDRVSSSGFFFFIIIFTTQKFRNQTLRMYSLSSFFVMCFVLRMALDPLWPGYPKNAATGYCSTLGYVIKRGECRELNWMWRSGQVATEPPLLRGHGHHIIAISRYCTMFKSISEWALPLHVPYKKCYWF